MWIRPLFFKLWGLISRNMLSMLTQYTHTGTLSVLSRTKSLSKKQELPYVLLAVWDFRFSFLHNPLNWIHNPLWGQRMRFGNSKADNFLGCSGTHRSLHYVTYCTFISTLWGGEAAVAPTLQVRKPVRGFPKVTQLNRSKNLDSGLLNFIQYNFH